MSGRAYVERQKALDPEGWARRRATHSLRQYRREGTANSTITRDARRATTRRWAERNPEKVRAHHAVESALRTGRLVRPDVCARCGTSCKPEASHDDYDQPLKVEWLCRPCHRRKDSKHQLTDEEVADPGLAARNAPRARESRG